MNKLIVAGAIALISTVSATAFDDLLRLAPTFPAGLDLPYVFDYTAPLGGFTPDAPTFYGPSDEQIRAALLAGEAPDALTGVDFSAVTAVLSIGDPPSTITVLFGLPGFADATPAALLGRDFEQSALEDVPVFSLGQDYAVDFANARQPDPFAQGMGKSQRILVLGDLLIRTAGWPELRSAVASLAGPLPVDSLWIATIRGLRNAAGDSPHLDIASGFSAAAFFDPGPDIGDLLADPQSIIKSQKKAPAPQENIVFPYALFAVSQNAERASTQIALPFGTEAEADNAGELLSDRLVVNPFTPSRPRVDIIPVDAYFIAVLSIDFPVAEAAAARDLYTRWMADIYQRKFVPLMLDF
jgi:hypothetical protein